MKIAALIIALLFLLFAGFQYNDADGFLWILVYLNIALLCIMASLGKFFRWWSIASLVLYSLYFLYLSPAIFEFFTNNFQENWNEGMSFEKEYIEKTREAGGLLISIAALAFLHFASKKRN